MRWICPYRRKRSSTTGACPGRASPGAHRQPARKPRPISRGQCQEEHVRSTPGRQHSEPRSGPSVHRRNRKRSVFRPVAALRTARPDRHARVPRLAARIGVAGRWLRPQRCMKRCRDPRVEVEDARVAAEIVGAAVPGRLVVERVLATWRPLPARQRWRHGTDVAMMLRVGARLRARLHGTPLGRWLPPPPNSARWLHAAGGCRGDPVDCEPAAARRAAQRRRHRSHSAEAGALGAKRVPVGK